MAERATQFRPSRLTVEDNEKGRDLGRIIERPDDGDWRDTDWWPNCLLCGWIGQPVRSSFTALSNLRAHLGLDCLANVEEG